MHHFSLDLNTEKISLPHPLACWNTCRSRLFPQQPELQLNISIIGELIQTFFNIWHSCSLFLSFDKNSLKSFGILIAVPSIVSRSPIPLCGLSWPLIESSWYELVDNEVLFLDHLTLQR